MIPACLDRRASSHPALEASLLASTCLAAAGVRAAHPLATDDAGTVGAGALETEVAVSAAQVNASADAPLHTGATLNLNWGMASSADLGVGLAYESVESEGSWTRGMADPQFNLKWIWATPRATAPGVGIRLDYRAPRLTEHEHTGHDFGGVLISTWESRLFVVHANFGGYALGLDTGEVSYPLYASAAGLFGLSDRAWAGLEVVFEGLSTDSVGAATLMPSFMWEFDRGVFSLGAGATWSEQDSVGWLATVGFTHAFGPEQ